MRRKPTTISGGRRDWSRDELLVVFRLYCETPFGKLHGRNPAIVELSSQLGRTASAVGMKACNFASLDPTQQARNIRALGNTSKADRELWAAFNANPEQIASEAEVAYHRLMRGNRTNIVTQMEIEIPNVNTEELRITRVRLVQSFFRRTVLASYENCCAISGIRSPELLNASHIIPWCDDVARRADPRNGIALNALYDRAFDRGLISFDESFCVLISPRLKAANPSELMRVNLLNIAGVPLILPQRFAPDLSCLAYHRNHVFLH